MKLIFLWFGLLPWVTWVLYLAAMSLKASRHELTPVAKILAYPVVALARIIDALLNLIPMTILFLELPKEWLFTHRCRRHLYSCTTRGRMARWFCANLLDVFDAGNAHCGRTKL